MEGGAKQHCTPGRENWLWEVPEPFRSLNLNYFGGATKTPNNKTHKQLSLRIVPGISGDCCACVFSSSPQKMGRTKNHHPAGHSDNQKNPRVRKNFVRDSGAGNGCANFMDAWKKCALSAGETHVHKIPRFRGGGVFWVLGGGGECRFYFYGRANFSDTRSFWNPHFWTALRVFNNLFCRNCERVLCFGSPGYSKDRGSQDLTETPPPFPGNTGHARQQFKSRYV